MSKLISALGSMLPMAARGRTCPDCGGMMSGGECPECGYGSDMEEEDEQAETQNLLDVKKALQNAMDLVDRMIVNNCD